MGIAPDELKQLYATFPTGVTVVATAHPTGIHGATVASFLGVSLDPPIVAVSLRREARLCSMIDGRTFSISVLATHQANLARHFAGATDESGSVTWTGGEGTLLAGASSHITCDPGGTVHIGDHVLVMGVVRTGEVFDQDPLIYHRGLVGDFADRNPDPA